MDEFNPLDTAAKKLMSWIRKKTSKQLILVKIEEAKRHLQMLGRKGLPTILYPEKKSFKDENETKILLDKLREFVTSSSAVKKA